MARTKLEFNPTQIEKMASVGLTQEEIAECLLCSLTTLKNALKKDPDIEEAYKRGKANLKMTIRRAQLQSAMKGNTAMLLLLGKEVLGQEDSEKINIKFKKDDTPSQQMNKVNQAVAKGKIAPGLGKTFNESISIAQKEELEELAESLRELEKELTRKLNADN